MILVRGTIIDIPVKAIVRDKEIARRGFIIYKELVRGIGTGQN